MEHLLYGELLKRAQNLMWTEAIFLAIINIFLWPSLGTSLFPTPAHRNQILHSLANIMFVIALADSDFGLLYASFSTGGPDSVGVRKTLIL